MATDRIIRIKAEDYERLKQARQSEFEPFWHVLRRLLDESPSTKKVVEG